jgi:protein-tyrosine phosphatase
MNDSTYVLLEYVPMVSYTILYQSLRKLILAHFTPILAHVERYQCLRKKGRVQELAACGCMLQMNYTSIIGSWLKKDVWWCRKQIQKELIHMFATDMHHADQRKPEIENALIWLKKHCSMDYYEKLVSDNSKVMLKEREENMGVGNENK